MEYVNRKWIKSFKICLGCMGFAMNGGIPEKQRKEARELLNMR
ncbi:MAG: hypothetical protein ACLRQF_00855 [Thomasclavelia ramosa]